MIRNPRVSNTAVDAVLSRLQNVRKSGARWNARCPAHADSHNSLSIGVGRDGQVLLKCFAGCATPAILEKIGIAMGDLFSKDGSRTRAPRRQESRPITVKDLAREKKLPNDFLLSLGLKNCERGVRVPYRLEDQTLAPRQRIRSALQAKKGSHWMRGKGRPVPYGLDRIKDAREAGFLILPEGESDCWTLWHHGFPGLGVPGASMTGLLEPAYLEGIPRLYAVKEPNEGGTTFTAGLVRRLREIAWKGELFVVTLIGFKDVNDLHRHDPERFSIAFQESIDVARPLTVPFAGAEVSHDTEETLELAYKVDGPGLIWLKPVSGERVEVKLTNFTARITAEVAEDDGADVRLALEIEAIRNGRTSRFAIPAAHFSSMHWPLEKLGAGAVIFPGSGIKDHARAAVQLLSGDVPRRTVFGHAGWRKIGDEWVYLHGGGAIGANGNLERVEVALPEALQSFVLPDAPKGQQLIDAWHSSLLLLDVATDTVSVGLFLAIWRAVIASTDFSVHLAGPTGVFKTELGALGMQHFGPKFDARHLPASWSSTGNSLEGLAFIAKDALLVIDDFAPTGSTADIQRYHKEADRVLRAQRNNAGRHRMRADATLKPSKPPRGLVLSTGEDVPRGQSLRAGMLVLEIGPNDVDQQLLTQAQTEAANGTYAQLMAGFLKWLAPRYEPMRERLRSRLTNLRLRATGSASHRRTPEIVANLMVGLDSFLDFGLEIGAVTEIEATRIRQRCWAALGKAAEAQTAHLRVSEPAQRFLELLGAAIASGRAHVADPQGYAPNIPHAWGWREFGKRNESLPEYRPQGDRVGWVEGPNLFLDLDAAFAAAQTIGRQLGDNIAVTPRTLSKRLHEKGVLVKTTTDSRQTFKVRHTLEGRRREVLHLAADVLGNYTCVGTDRDEGTAQERNAEPTSPAVAQSADNNPTTNPTIVSSVAGPDAADLVGLVGSDTGNEPFAGYMDEFALHRSEGKKESIQPHNPTNNLTTAEDVEEISGEEIV